MQASRRFFSSQSIRIIHKPPNRAALIVGAGDSTGGAIAKRFARAGLIACPVRRSKPALDPLIQSIQSTGGTAIPFGVDCRKEEAVISLVDEIERDIAPIDVAVFNIGANVQYSILETSAKKYYKVWEMACFAGFLMGREVAKRMVPRQRGTILFTGATASMRGGNGYCAFAGAKHGLRALAQSMARELGPKGIHVAHVVIDGAIDTPWIRETFGVKAVERSAVEGLLLPEDIAENYFWLYQQPRNAWTHELDLRPWNEKW